MSTSRKPRTLGTDSSKTGGVALMRRPPLHPGDLFREVREGQEPPVSQRQSAFRLGISVKHMHDIERGAKPVSVAIAVKLERLTGVSAETWLTLQMRHDLWHELQAAKKIKRLIPGEPFDTARLNVP